MAEIIMASRREWQSSAISLQSLELAASKRRGQERGVARPEVLQALLASTDRVVQEVDSVEYGLTDIQVQFGSSRPSTVHSAGPEPV